VDLFLTLSDLALLDLLRLEILIADISLGPGFYMMCLRPIDLWVEVSWSVDLERTKLIFEGLLNPAACAFLTG
jgi:hypothetical protein